MEWKSFGKSRRESDHASKIIGGLKNLDADKPNKVKMLYVPIYESDQDVISMLPPTATGQWARQLIKKALQIESAFMETVLSDIPVHLGDDKSAADEVRTIVKAEIEGLIPKIETAIQEEVQNVTTQKLESLQVTIRDAIQEAVKTSFLNQQEDFFSNDPLTRPTVEDEKSQPWMQSARREIGK